MSRKRIMVTGVYGLIGGAVYDRLTASPDRYDVYGLARRQQPSDRVREGHAIEVPDEKFVLSNLSDLNLLTQAMEGMDVVVHMAADPGGQRGWDSLLTNNITGAYHLFEACRRADVKRVIYASSKQVINGYRGEEPYSDIAEGCWEGTGDPPMVTHHSPVRPVSIYACTKVWGEALAQHYADRYGLSCLCLRIGWVVAEDRPPHPGATDDWCSQRDIARLTECCINAPDNVRFDIFHGLSNSSRLWADIAHAREVVGYVPQDSAEDYLV